MDNKDVNQYLNNIFQKVPSNLLRDTRPNLDLTKYIFDKLIRKKFRRRKLGQQSGDNLYQKVKTSVLNNEPLYLSVFFGGYKHFWNPSFPQPDWAELFSLRYMIDYVLPVLTVYRPGVIIEYVSEDIILSRMNNYPIIDLNKYNQEFHEIINMFNSISPINLKFRFLRIADKFTREEIVSNVEKLLPERLTTFNNLTLEEKDRELKRSRRSYMWKGEIDYSLLAEGEKEQKLSESRQIELGYYEVEAYPKYFGEYIASNKIPILTSFGLSSDNVYDDLTIGSTYGSIVDFWIGRGILEVHKNKFVPNIISKNQYQKAKSNLQIVKIDNPIIDFINFKTIEVLNAF